MPQSPMRHRDRADETPLRFPRPEPERDATNEAKSERSEAEIRAEDALEAVESMSRKIRDLARELNCLGYFDEGDDDRPRAA